MADRAYPFIPKSTHYLEPGQFWGIPLEHGRYACGRVLGTVPDSRRLFVAGLLDWCALRPPDEVSIAGRPVLEQGRAHIKTITENGGAILGCRPLDLDGIRNEWPEHTWGYDVIVLLAENHFSDAS